MATPWITFVRERFPLPVYFLLCAGIAYTGARVAQDPSLLKSLIAFLTLLAFFFLLRTMDELKDFEKDVIANPSRPLPRGLLTPGQVARFIQRSWWALLLLGVSLFAVSTMAASSFFIFWIYLWLMYKEFYVGTKLQSYPLLYAISHQIILLPICAFAVAIHSSPIGPLAFYYGLTVLGSFFGYEVARKLNPQSHHLLKTYLHIYGPWRVWFLILATQALAAFGASKLHLQMQGWLFAAEVAFVLLSLLVVLSPKRYKWIEGFAALSLALHIWIGALT